MRTLELVNSAKYASLFKFEFIFSTLSSKNNTAFLDIFLLKVYKLVKLNYLF